MIPLAPPPPDKEPDIDLGPKRPPGPKVRARIEAQTPHHLGLAGLMLRRVVEDVRQRRPGLGAPRCDAAVGVGEGGEGDGGAEGFEEREGDVQVAGGESGRGVEDVAGYGVFVGGGGGGGGEEGLHFGLSW